MTLRTITFFAAVLFFSVITTASTVEASSLKIAPLEYRTTLKEGEKQKGFIDISNPSSRAVVVKTSVEAFTQTDDKGSLMFFKNEQLSAGILLDLDEFQLGPREAVRMYFLADGTKLPTGDVYGAIFFSTVPAEQGSAGTAQSVRLGTLLSIVNGTPGERKAEVTALAVPAFNLGNVLEGTYRVKNTADPQKSTGFYPNVSVKVWPLGERKTKNGPLVFAGRTRENTFSVNAPRIGIYQVSASYGSSSQSKWVVVAHPVAIIVLVVLATTLHFAYLFKKKKSQDRMNRQR